MSKKTIIKGTLILTIAGLLTKILGFYNRIFLTRLIGVVELGKYQLIFPLYLFIFALTSQGIATTLTKQISYYMGTESNDKAKYIFRFSLIISTVTSLIIALLIYCFSDFISLKLLKNSDCGELLRVITIAVPFVAAKACINAYFIGIDKPIYHGLSHLIEQIIRIGAAYLLSLMVFAELVNAKLAVKAVVIGELSATVLAVIFYAVIQNKYKKRIYKPNYISKKDRKLTLHYFIKDALPITVNNLIFTLFSTFEAIIMPARLYFYYGSSDKALEMFGKENKITRQHVIDSQTNNEKLLKELGIRVQNLNDAMDYSKPLKAQLKDATDEFKSRLNELYDETRKDKGMSSEKVLMVVSIVNTILLLVLIGLIGYSFLFI